MLLSDVLWCALWGYPEDGRWASAGVPAPTCSSYVGTEMSRCTLHERRNRALDQSFQSAYDTARLRNCKNLDAKSDINVESLVGSSDQAPLDD